MLDPCSQVSLNKLFIVASLEKMSTLNHSFLHSLPLTSHLVIFVLDSDTSEVDDSTPAAHQENYATVAADPPVLKRRKRVVTRALTAQQRGGIKRPDDFSKCPFHFESQRCANNYSVHRFLRTTLFTNFVIYEPVQSVPSEILSW